VIEFLLVSIIEKRGGIGPSIFPLCLNNEESTEHLLISGEVSQHIWQEVYGLFKISISWSKMNMSENILQWFLTFPHHRIVTFVVLWRILHYKINILFEDCSRNEHSLCLRIVSDIKEIPSDYTYSPCDFLLNPIYFDKRAIGFFNGVAARGECGVGIELRLNGSHYYRIFLAIGPGSNTKAKLLVIWGLLSFASYLHISEIMVDGDSKNILDWFEGRYQLQVPSLLS